MPRARNDPYKRKSAQALNHLAAAILDINDIYIPFETQMEMLKKQFEQSQDPQKEKDFERYSQYVHDLYTVMMGISAVREHIIFFIGEVWNLDEESVKVYMS